MSTSIDVFSEYPKEKFIPLIPVQTITQISPLHKMAVNIVQISTEENDKDVYKLNGENALAKKGLLKLAAAANIQIMESKKVPPSSCEKCLEMARATGKPSACGACLCKSDVAYEVTISIPDPAGGSRIVKASREFICEDEKEKMHKKPDPRNPDRDLDAQYKQAFPFRGAITESKALTRALRAALMVKGSYSAEELKKPFAVPVIVPDATDPEMKKAMIERFKHETKALYSGSVNQAAIGTGQQVTVITADEDDVIDTEATDFTDMDTLGSDGNVDTEFDIKRCADCGADILPFHTSKRDWTAEDWVAFTQKKYGLNLCTRCGKTRNDAETAGGAK